MLLSNLYRGRPRTHLILINDITAALRVLFDFSFEWEGKERLQMGKRHREYIHQPNFALRLVPGRNRTLQTS
jgi:hypothetical protein